MITRVKNEVYVPFSFINNRKLALFYKEGRTYLFRVYFAEAVDQIYRDNTYVEFISL